MDRHRVYNLGQTHRVSGIKFTNVNIGLYKETVNTRAAENLKQA